MKILATNQRYYRAMFTAVSDLSSEPGERTARISTYGFYSGITRYHRGYSPQMELLDRCARHGFRVHLLVGVPPGSIRRVLDQLTLAIRRWPLLTVTWCRNLHTKCVLLERRATDGSLLVGYTFLGGRNLTNSSYADLSAMSTCKAAYEEALGHFLDVHKEVEQWLARARFYDRDITMTAGIIGPAQAKASCVFAEFTEHHLPTVQEQQAKLVSATAEYFDRHSLDGLAVEQVYWSEEPENHDQTKSVLQEPSR